MSRIPLVDPSEAEGKARELLDSAKAKIGRVPNMMKAMAAAPAVLEGYMGLSGALGKGTLDRKLREQIALALAEINGCHYCVAAHSLIGKHAGLDESELLAARRGRSADPKAEAGLDFARLVLERRGDVSDEDLDRVRAAGYGDAEIAEIVGHVALSLLTNSFNNVAEPPVDFPAAPALGPDSA